MRFRIGNFFDRWDRKSPDREAAGNAEWHQGGWLSKLLGNDRGVYEPATAGSGHLHLDGGRGCDTLELRFTSEEWAQIAVQQEVRQFATHLEENVTGAWGWHQPWSDTGLSSGSGGWTQGGWGSFLNRGWHHPWHGDLSVSYEFNSLNLTASNFEKLVVLVDGERIDLSDDTNSAPDAVDDMFETERGTPIAGSLFNNDTDADGDPLIVTEVNGADTQVDMPIVLPSGARLTVRSDGSFEFLPGETFDTEETFTYTISDGEATDTANVTIRVTNPENTPPVAGDDKFVTNDANPIAGKLLDNDTDADGDPLTIKEINGNPTFVGIPLFLDSGAEITVMPDGKFDYKPVPGWTGEDKFTYAVTDGKSSDMATVTITVGKSNNAPVAMDDFFFGPQNGEIRGNLLINDSDPDGDFLSVIGGTRILDEGTAEIGSNGDLSFMPVGGFLGPVTFEYEITDGVFTDTARVNIEINPVAEEPDARDDEATTQQDKEVLIDILSNDTPGGLLVTTALAESGQVLVGENGNLLYTPPPGFVGQDIIRYTVQDANGLTDGAMVTVTITPAEIQRPPVAADDFASTQLGIPINVFVLNNDFDPDGDVINIVDFEMGRFGSVIQQGDILVYTPIEGFVGEDSFEYTISDPLGQSDTARVTVSVVLPNQPPQAVDDFAFTNQGSAVSISVLDNDFDPDGEALSIVDFTTLTDNAGTVAQSGGSLIYTPAFGFVGQDMFAYTISDPTGNTDTARVSVSVNPINLAPQANDDFASTEPGVPVNILVLANDVDPDGDPLNLIDFPETTLFGGTVEAVGDALAYTPAFGFIGQDSFSYTIADAFGVTDVATVNVNVVEPVVDPPLSTLAIADASAEEGAGKLSFTVTRSGSLDEAVFVSYETVDWSAEAVSGLPLTGDFFSDAGTLVFNPGEVEKAITIDLLDDELAEDTETFLVRLSDATPDLSNIVDDMAIGTILDDDALLA